MACTIRPPPPGPHLERDSCWLSPVISCQLFPPSSLRKRQPGSTPHHKVSGCDSRSATTFHTRAKFKPRSLENSRPALDCVHFFPWLWLTWTSCPHHMLLTAAHSFPVRGSRVRQLTSLPAKNGPSIFQLLRRRSLRARN